MLCAASAYINLLIALSHIMPDRFQAARHLDSDVGLDRSLIQRLR